MPLRTKAVEGGSHRDRFGVFGGHISWKWLLAGGVRAPRVEEAGEGETSEGEEGGPGPPQII